MSHRCLVKRRFSKSVNSAVFLLHEILLEAFKALPRTELDKCQLACSGWKDTIAAKAAILPRRRMGVGYYVSLGRINLASPNHVPGPGAGAGLGFLVLCMLISMLGTGFMSVFLFRFVFNRPVLAVPIPVLAVHYSHCGRNCSDFRKAVPFVLVT